VRTHKNGFTSLSRAEHGVLVEALRRRERFNDLHQSITTQWTGLGVEGEYKAAMSAGFMQRTSTPNPRNLEWWMLTPRGAQIIAYWIGQGYTFERIEAGDVPTVIIPTTIL